MEAGSPSWRPSKLEQQRLLPELEQVDVTNLARADSVFRLTLSNGAHCLARRVVVAVGITHFGHVPDALAALPRDLASHTSQHRDYDPFVGKDVCVIGAGQSALEACRLLLDSGARPLLLTRASNISFSDKMPPHRGLWQRIRRPLSGLGPGLMNWVLEKAPLLMHFVPVRWRLPFVKNHLGPQGAWWLRDRIVGRVPMLTNVQVIDARPSDGRLALQLCAGNGSQQLLACDHVIAGTGYVVDVDRLAFIDADLRRSIRRIERGPALDTRFQSSVPGLYFVGLASSLSFGPLFRFVVGAAFTSRAVSRELARHRNVRAPTATATQKVSSYDAQGHVWR